MQRNSIKSGHIGKKKKMSEQFVRLGSTFYSNLTFGSFSNINYLLCLHYVYYICEDIHNNCSLGKWLKYVKAQEITSKMKPRKLTFLSILACDCHNLALSSNHHSQEYGHVHLSQRFHANSVVGSFMLQQEYLETWWPVGVRSICRRIRVASNTV